MRTLGSYSISVEPLWGSARLWTLVQAWCRINDVRIWHLSYYTLRKRVECKGWHYSWRLTPSIFVGLTCKPKQVLQFYEFIKQVQPWMTTTIARGPGIYIMDDWLAGRYYEVPQEHRIYDAVPLGDHLRQFFRRWHLG